MASFWQRALTFNGYDQSKRSVRDHVQGSLKRHWPGIDREEACPCDGISLSPSSARFAWNPGFGLPGTQQGDLCAWVFLARSQMLAWPHAENEAGILDSEDKREQGS